MFRIRRATIDGSERVAAVHIRIWQAAYADVLPAGYLAAHDQAEWAGRHRRVLAGRASPTEVFVAEVDGEAAALGRVTRPEAEDPRRLTPPARSVRLGHSALPHRLF